MPALHSGLEALFDGNGEHVGGIYPPLAAGDQLTVQHQLMVAACPARTIVWKSGEQPAWLGLLWFMPAGEANPLAASPHAFGHLVQTLEAGHSVALYAATAAAIDATCRTVASMLGGGHA